MQVLDVSAQAGEITRVLARNNAGIDILCFCRWISRSLQYGGMCTLSDQISAFSLVSKLNEPLSSLSSQPFKWFVCLLISEHCHYSQ